MDLLTDPIVLAAAGGLAVALIVYINGLRSQRSLKNEIAGLKEHLHRHMTINEKGNNAIIRENTTLTKQVTTLENSLATLSSNASKSELRSLFLLEKGIQLMYIKIPSFAGHWETYKIEADAELEKIFAGEVSWPRQIIRRSLGLLFTDKSPANFPPNTEIDLKKN